MGRDPEIVVAYPLATTFQRCADITVVEACLDRHGLNWQDSHQGCEGLGVALNVLAFLYAAPEFTIGDDRNTRVPGGQFGQLAGDSGRLVLDEVDAGIGIE